MDNSISSVSTKSSFPTLIQSEIATLRNTYKVSGSLSEMSYDGINVIGEIQGLAGSTSYIDPQEKPFHRIIQPFYEKCFTDTEMHFIEEVYKAVYPRNNFLNLCRFYKEFKTLTINGDEYVSLDLRDQLPLLLIGQALMEVLIQWEKHHAR